MLDTANKMIYLKPLMKIISIEQLEEDESKTNDRAIDLQSRC